MAWDPNLFSLLTTHAHTLSLTTTLSSTTTHMSMTLTNVYARVDHSHAEEFALEMASPLQVVTGPWLILGDFSLIQYPHEKNSNKIDRRPAAVINDLIHSKSLFKLPLLDRLYTWTNKRDPPTIVRLDRTFFNLDWDNSLPNSSLTSLPRPTSDHTPLLVQASTTIACPNQVWFENTWLLNPSFLLAPFLPGLILLSPMLQP